MASLSGQTDIVKITASRTVAISKNKQLFLFDADTITSDSATICGVADKYKNIKLTVKQPAYKIDSLNDDDTIILHIYKNENIVRSFNVEYNTSSVLFSKDVDDLNLFADNIDRSYTHFIIETHGQCSYIGIILHVEMYLYSPREYRIEMCYDANQNPLTQS